MPRAREYREPSRYPARSISSGDPHRPQRGKHDLSLVERHFLGPQHLIGLVAFASEQDGIARLCEGERPVDRFSAILNPEMRYVSHAFFDFVNDASRVFGSRVIRGHDREVSTSSRYSTHHRPFPTVAIATFAE